MLAQSELSTGLVDVSSPSTNLISSDTGVGTLSSNQQLPLLPEIQTPPVLSIPEEPHLYDPNSGALKKTESALSEVVLKAESVSSGTSTIRASPVKNNGSAGGRKRSRKQQISAISETLDISPEREHLSPPKRKKAKVGAKSASVGSEKKTKSKAKKLSLENEREETLPIKISAVRSVKSSPKPKKGTNKGKKGSLNQQQTENKSIVPSIGIQKRISLKRTDLIYPNLSFKSFLDTSRNVTAIAPSQLLIAAESIVEIGKEEDIFTGTLSNNEIVDNSNSVKREFEPAVNLLSTYFTSPHYLPFNSLYSASEPFTRVVRYSSLEQLSNFHKEKFEPICKTFLCPSGRPVLQPSSSLAAKKGYSRNSVVIKHPVLRFVSGKAVVLKFLVLKKIPLGERTLGVAKAKIYELFRTRDRVNVQIKIKQSSISEKACDVNAMNQQNIQPVILTDTGIRPVLSRTASEYLQLPQQQTQIRYLENFIPPPQHSNHSQQQYFDYLPYTHETATELVYNPLPLPTTPLASTFNEQPHTVNFSLEPSGDSSYVLIPSHSGDPSVNNSVVGKERYVIIKPPDSLPIYNPQVPSIRVVQQNVLEFVGPSQNQNQLVQSLQGHNQQQVTQEVPRQIICLEGNPSSSHQLLIQQPSSHNKQLFLNAQLQQPQFQQNQITHQSLQINQPLVVQDIKPILNQSQFLDIQQSGHTTQNQNHYIHQQHLSSPQQPAFPPPQSQQPHRFVIQTVNSQQQSQQVPCNTQLLVRPQNLGQLQHSSISNSPASFPVNQSPLSVATAGNLYNNCDTQVPPQPKTSTKGKRKSKKEKVQSESLPVAVSIPEDSGSCSSSGVPTPAIVKSDGKSGQIILIAPPGTKHNPLPKQQQTPEFSRVSTTTTPAHVSSLPNSAGANLAGTQLAEPILVGAGGNVLKKTTGSPSIKKIYICNNNFANSNAKSSSASTSAVVSGDKQSVHPSLLVKQEVVQAVPKVSKRPGYVALCPHCGFSSVNILKCDRCKTELPESVRLIKDQWAIDPSNVAVANPPVTTSVVVTSDTATTANTILVNSATTVNTGKARGGSPRKKIRVVNKPAIITNQVGVLSSGVVQVQIQTDGSSSVKIVPSIVPITTVGGKSAILQNKPIPKRRAPARRKPQECITLSSDEEEPEPPKQPSTDNQSSGLGVKPDSADAEDASAGDKTGGTSQLVSSNTTGVTETGPVSPPETNEMAKQRSLSINIKEEEPEKTDNNEVETSPEELYAKIEQFKQSPLENNFEFSMLECRSIRIGSYKVTAADHGTLTVTVSQYGFSFKLPYSNMKHTIKKICIPMAKVLNLQACFHRKNYVLFVKTGPKFAGYIRKELGMADSPTNETSNYYCPLNGHRNQKTIIFLVNVITEADAGIIKKVCANLLQELDAQKANLFLMDTCANTFKQNINYKPDPNSPASSTLLKEKLTSGAGQASSSSVTTSVTVASTSSNLEQNVQSRTKPSIVNCPPQNHNPDETIWCYEGKNTKIPISAKDISCLGFEEFLNDQIIDFWLAVIQNEIFSEDFRKRTFVYDTFFYSKLTEKKRKMPEDGEMTAPERRHARVMKRTKNVDIFEKDFLVIPVNENFHWFLVVICFPGMDGYHDYDTLEPLPNYVSTVSKKRKTSSNKNSPIISKQPQNQSTAAYSDRDEAPEDPEEAQDLNRSPEEESGDTEPCDGKTEPEQSTPTEEKSKNKKRRATSPVDPTINRQRVKHPCILIFDSLAHEDAHARIYSTLREYLKIEYKVKKNEDRVFDKTRIPGIMPKVPQQANYSDCGLFMLQYIESLFSDPIPSYDVNHMKLRGWFDPVIAQTKKRIQIFEFIKKKVEEKCPQNLCRIPEVNFEARADTDDCNFDDDDDCDDDDEYDDEEMDEEEDEEFFSGEEYSSEDEDEDMFDQVTVKLKHPTNDEHEERPSKKNPDHDYATGAANKHQITEASDASTTSISTTTEITSTSPTKSDISKTS